MEGVSQTLQFSVVINWSGPLSIKPQLLQKLYLLLGGSPAEGTVLKEFREPRLFVWLRRPGFDKLKSPWIA